jgi:ABC-type iron transport system FetAB permease component
MEHLITFLSMLGTITLVMIVLLLIGRGFSILAKKEKIKLTKARVWYLFKSTLELTTLLFLLRLAITIDSTVLWLLLLIYMLVTNISEDQNDLSNHKTHH